MFLYEDTASFNLVQRQLFTLGSNVLDMSITSDSAFMAVAVMSSIYIFVNNAGVWSPNQTIPVAGAQFSQTSQLTDDHQYLVWAESSSNFCFVTPFDAGSHTFNVAASYNFTVNSFMKAILSENKNYLIISELFGMSIYSNPTTDPVL